MTIHKILAFLLRRTHNEHTKQYDNLKLPLVLDLIAGEIMPAKYIQSLGVMFPVAKDNLHSNISYMTHGKENIQSKDYHFNNV